MPYLVLALGLLMSAIGLGAISFGYPIVQVERGWSSVIAGATMLTGGLMTVALALIFHSLVGLKKALLRRASGLALQPSHDHASLDHATHEHPGFDAAMSEAPLLTPALVPVAPPLGAVLATEVFEDPSHDNRVDEHAYVPSETRAPIDEVALYEAAMREQPAEAFEPAMREPAVYEPPAQELIHEAAGHETPAPEPAAEETPPTPLEPAPIEAFAPPTAHEPAPSTSLPRNADSDWLDRAFSDLDHDLAAGSRVPAHIPLDADPVHDVEIPEPLPTAPHLSEPAAEHVPAHEPASDVALAERPAPETSDVIGRYEADGTSYTMYADGSIEAQSEAGLYRFASMAELKAFIEG